MGSALYDTFINEAKERGYLNKTSANPFMPGASIVKYYDDYKSLEKTYAKSTGASPLEIAELRYSSKSNDMQKFNDETNPINQYQSDDKALNFFRENSAFYSSPDNKSRYMNYINNDLERMKQMSEEDAAAEYENKLSETQKSALKLMGVDGSDAFKSMIKTVQLNDDLNNGTANIVKSPEGKTLVEYPGQEVQVEEGSTIEKDVDWGDVGKGAAAGAAAGAAIGTLVAGWTFGIGTAIGAAVGGVIGAATEVLDMYSEDEVIESVNDAKRNFVSAMYGSTVGMLGDAAAGVGNVFNTGLSWAAGGDAEDFATYNPLNLLEGVTDGLDDFLIEKQKNEYRGFSKFLVTDVMSVAGSLAGFAVMGAAMGSVFGAGEVTVKGGAVMNSMFGGTKAEIATRAVVALGAADDTYDASKAEGASDEDALFGSLITAGANWAVLAKTKAIPGVLTRGAQESAQGLATSELIKTVSMEMFTEAVEEIGEELAADLGKTYGTKSNKFKNVKDYAYVGFLGAIGGAFGAGIGTMNYANAINKIVENDLKPLNEGLVTEKINDFMAKGMTEIQAKDKALKYFNENGIAGIPVGVLRSLIIEKAEEYKIAFAETQKYVDEKLRPKAEEILNKSTSLDNTEVNQNKIIGIMLEADMQQNTEVKAKLEAYPEAVAKMNNPENISTLLSLSNEDIEMIQGNSKNSANLLVEEFADRGYSEMYKEISSKDVKTAFQARDIINKYNLTSNKLENLRSRELISQETALRLKQYTDAFEQSLDRSVSAFLENGNITELKQEFELLSNDQIIDYFDRNKTSTEERYKVLDALGKTAIDPRTKNLGKTVKVLSNFARTVNTIQNKVGKSKTAQNTSDNVKSIRKQLDKLDTIKSELKAQYGSLKNVPWETINKLTDDNLTFEEFKQYERELKNQLRVEKANIKSRSAEVEKHAKKSEPAFSFVNEIDYYKSKRNSQVAISDEIRKDYHHSLVKAMMLGNMPENIAAKYNYDDHQHFIAQLTFRNPTIYNDMIKSEIERKDAYALKQHADGILDENIYTHLDEKFHEAFNERSESDAMVASSRKVFAISEDAVIKIAMQEGAGKAQNRAEHYLSKEVERWIDSHEQYVNDNYADMTENEYKSELKLIDQIKRAYKHLTLTHTVHNDGHFVVSERVTPYNDDDWNLIADHLIDAGELDESYRNEPYLTKWNAAQDWVNEVFGPLESNFPFLRSDIVSGNMGFRADGTVVVLDYGFNKTVGRVYYRIKKGENVPDLGTPINYISRSSFDTYETALDVKQQEDKKIKEIELILNELHKIKSADPLYDERVNDAKKSLFQYNEGARVETMDNAQFDSFSTDSIGWYSQDYNFREYVDKFYFNRVKRGRKSKIPTVTSYNVDVKGNYHRVDAVDLENMIVGLVQRLVGKNETDYIIEEAGLKEFLMNPIAVLKNDSKTFEWLDFSEESEWMALLVDVAAFTEIAERASSYAFDNNVQISADVIFELIQDRNDYFDFDLLDVTIDEQTGAKQIGDGSNGFLDADELSMMWDDYDLLQTLISEGSLASTGTQQDVKSISDIKSEGNSLIKNKVVSNMNDVTKVRNATTNTEVIGVGIDYNGTDRTIKVYEVGEEISNDHQFFYDKEALIIAILQDNNNKTIEEDGELKQCGV